METKYGVITVQTIFFLKLREMQAESSSIKNPRLKHGGRKETKYIIIDADRDHVISYSRDVTHGFFFIPFFKLAPVHLNTRTHTRTHTHSQKEQ